MVKVERDETSKKPDQWQVDEWCRCLMEAEEIKADPEKMALCKEKMHGKMKAIKSITDLKDLADKKSKMKMDDMDEDDMGEME